MTAFEIIPFILFLVVIGTAIAERINVPHPLVLVVTGLIVGFIPGIPNWHPPSDLVLPLFLPPILFAAARLISWEDIQNNKSEISSLSILLVIASTIVIGVILAWIVPGMPLSASLVLGAIISPTDAIASTSILNRMRIPKHIIRSLEVESLFNDAVSIVLYNMGLMFVFMGAINLLHAGESMLIVGLGGIAVGLMFSYFTSLIVKEFLTESENELPIIMSVILAYVSYLFADRIGVSGVLAVVAAGLFHKRTEKTIKARTRLSEKSVWDTLIFFLNGLIFIVIGMQFPNFLGKVNYLPIGQLILFSTITVLSLILLRFIWVLATNLLVNSLSRLRKHPTKRYVFSWREVLISSWSGMRGLVSLALALALPIMLPDTTPFPYRDLIIFLTIIAILFTLLVQGLTLPYLVKLLKSEKSDAAFIKESSKIYRRLTKEAIQHIDQLDAGEHICSENAKKLVNNYYANRLLQFKVTYETECDTHEVGHEAEALLSKILNYERNRLHEMRFHGEVSEEVYIRILSKIDRDEVGFASYK
ncbi:Na+/H+ antiporter [Coxiella burnetii]|uniref:Na+/H+ antiporter n=1 Tax=Coxiella burnetii (strain Dugway 5J108-111) TaxID=434922 RepID=A9KFV7_COXBN|nr:Na+/H+ antiporter [Coxiella burnetii]ABS76728.1 Na+/H+ antiporter [Coxiella burnetii Dugway 5J108-111]OYK80107.1 Na+/H+ antiporter [Coxiella burnetii]OYK82188.1 Na+/H+ antiporter [Coxiella burnetii]